MHYLNGGRVSQIVGGHLTPVAILFFFKNILLVKFFCLQFHFCHDMMMLRWKRKFLCSEYFLLRLLEEEVSTKFYRCTPETSSTIQERLLNIILVLLRTASVPKKSWILQKIPKRVGYFFSTICRTKCKLGLLKTFNPFEFYSGAGRHVKHPLFNRPSLWRWERKTTRPAKSLSFAALGFLLFPLVVCLIW